MHAALAARHGRERQARFLAGKVAICGLGGLGSNVAVALARAGVGQLHLIDFDRVDISNLNRQQYKACQIGMPKTEALRENLMEIAPYCRIRTDCVRLTAENAVALLQDDEILCEAFDAPECKAMLIDAVSERLPDKWLVAASGMAGLSSANTIRTRRITRRLYLCGDGESDVATEGTLFSSRVMLCAAHEANLILRILAGINEES